MTVVTNVWAPLEERNVNHAPQLSIAGDSAGGAICATISSMSQADESIDIRRQVLIYPSLDYTQQSESMDENGTGYLLHKDKVTWYFDNYFQNNEDRKEASPLYMPGIRSISETLLISAEFCPLRDEGLTYLQKLNEAGIKTEHLHFDDMIHAFLNLEDLVSDKCALVYEKIAMFLNKDT